MSRQNQILSILLALQIVVAAAVFWPRPAATAAGGSLFAGVTADKIAKLTVSDATSQQVQLAKGPNGWALPQADDYPCQAGKVQPLLDKIVALKTNRLVAQTSTSQKQLKVADQDFERSIEFELADGTRHKLYLGTSAGYQATHVRVQGKNEIYLASGLSTADVSAQASGWVDTAYFAVPQDQVTALTLENKNGRFELEKNDAGAWTLKGLAAGETVSDNNIQSMLTQVASIALTQPLGKKEQEAYGLKAPNAVVTVKTRDQAGTIKTSTLRVGAKDDKDGSFVVISSESPYYVRVAGYSVQNFVEKARDYFLQLPPTPAPASTPTRSP
jgi:hypothetical protein